MFLPEIEIIEITEHKDGSATVEFTASKETREWLCGQGLKSILENHIKEMAKEAEDD